MKLAKIVISFKKLPGYFLGPRRHCSPGGGKFRRFSRFLYTISNLFEKRGRLNPYDSSKRLVGIGSGAAGLYVPVLINTSLTKQVFDILRQPP